MALPGGPSCSDQYATRRTCVACSPASTTSASRSLKCASCRTRNNAMSEDEESTGRHEWVAVVVLAVTAVLTAWSGFEASKWGGEMSIAFSKASAARIEAARHAAEADAARGFDLNVFGIYVQAVAEGDTTLREFVETRFTDHFAVAFDSWLGTRPLENPDAP